MSWQQTFTGQKVDLEFPNPDSIRIEDIAHALSHICRFAGNTPKFYSVAQHSILVSKHLAKHWNKEITDPDAYWTLRLYGLLHDCAETYIGDIPRQAKQFSPEISRLELNIQRVAFQQLIPSFVLQCSYWNVHAFVKEADNIILAWEGKSLFDKCVDNWHLDLGVAPPRGCIFPEQNPRKMEKAFLAEYRRLYKSAVARGGPP